MSNIQITETKELTIKQLCKGLKQIGGEDIVFDDGFSLETWCNDCLFVILGFFKSVKKFHKRLDSDDSYVETYLNYYPKERCVILEIFNATSNGTQDEIEITGEAKDFLIKEIENWCEDYRHCTPMEMLEKE